MEFPTDVAVVEFYVPTSAYVVSGWAHRTGLPGWVQPLPGRWCLLRAAVTGRRLVGAEALHPKTALRQLDALAAGAHLVWDDAE